MTVKPIRIGLIGGGMMSQVAHLPFYLADPRCEVLRVAESRPSLIAALGKQLGSDRIVADHGALLDDATIEAVVINPDPNDHSTLYIDIQYLTKDTNDRRNLVFPFYTIPEDGSDY